MTKIILNILGLYPDLLNLYGDRGNIFCLKTRIEARGFGVNIHLCTIDNQEIDWSIIDIIFIGGGSDREQQIVSRELLKFKDDIFEHIESKKPMLAVCAGFQLLGNYYETKEGQIEGLSILDVVTKTGTKRNVGDIILYSKFFDSKIIGFENHIGITNCENYDELGQILFGVSKEHSKSEGIIYKNLFATYLHGPLLPKNPKVADHIILSALKFRYSVDKLSTIDDSLENKARRVILNRFH